MDAIFSVDLTSLGLTDEQLESINKAIRRAVVAELIAINTVAVDAISVNNPANTSTKGMMGFGFIAR